MREMASLPFPNDVNPVFTGIAKAFTTHGRCSICIEWACLWRLVPMTISESYLIRETLPLPFFKLVHGMDTAASVNYTVRK